MRNNSLVIVCVTGGCFKHKTGKNGYFNGLFLLLFGFYTKGDRGLLCCFAFVIKITS